LVEQVCRSLARFGKGPDGVRENVMVVIGPVFGKEEFHEKNVLMTIDVAPNQ
jgi:hypothetical protein